MKIIKIKTKFGEYYFQITPWRRMWKGGIHRQIITHLEITTKTRKFEQSMYVSAVITKGELFDNSGVITKLRQDKTYNMKESARFLIEDFHGKGKNFLHSRGRFTVLRMKNKLKGKDK